VDQAGTTALAKGLVEVAVEHADLASLGPRLRGDAIEDRTEVRRDPASKDALRSILLEVAGLLDPERYGRQIEPREERVRPRRADLLLALDHPHEPGERAASTAEALEREEAQRERAEVVADAAPERAPLRDAHGERISRP